MEKENVTYPEGGKTDLMKFIIFMNNFLQTPIKKFIYKI